VLIHHRGHTPVVHSSAYVAPTATLVGDVRVGPRARIMYGAVLDAEASYIEVGEACVISEQAVLRATAVAAEPLPVILADHIFVGPHATLLGCRIDRCCYLAAQATVLQAAHLHQGAVIAVGALAHASTVVPAEMFVPPMAVAIGNPARIVTPDRVEELAEAIRGVNFAATAFGVDYDWTERTARYERMTEVRVEEYGAHADDQIVG
jgi:carbonic anhydrase/acetyltransferase-like protein (isoleucine patch superfamily)